MRGEVVAIIRLFAVNDLAISANEKEAAKRVNDVAENLKDVDDVRRWLSCPGRLQQLSV